jgi:hypothetical protein
VRRTSVCAVPCTTAGCCVGGPASMPALGRNWPQRRQRFGKRALQVQALPKQSRLLDSASRHPSGVAKRGGKIGQRLARVKADFGASYLA